MRSGPAWRTSSDRQLRRAHPLLRPAQLRASSVGASWRAARPRRRKDTDRTNFAAPPAVVRPYRLAGAMLGRSDTNVGRIVCDASLLLRPSPCDPSSRAPCCSRSPQQDAQTCPALEAANRHRLCAVERTEPIEADRTLASKGLVTNEPARSSFEGTIWSGGQQSPYEAHANIAFSLCPWTATNPCRCLS